MELLILKSGITYIRVKENRFLRVALDKASVFPMNQMDLVKEYEVRLKAKGFEFVSIKRLILTEEDL
jgi:hypothetical protein